MERDKYAQKYNRKKLYEKKNNCFSTIFPSFLRPSKTKTHNQTTTVTKHTNNTNISKDNPHSITPPKKTTKKKDKKKNITETPSNTSFQSDRIIPLFRTIKQIISHAFPTRKGNYATQQLGNISLGCATLTTCSRVDECVLVVRMPVYLFMYA